MVKKTVALGSFAALALGGLGCHGASVSFHVDDHLPQRHVYVNTSVGHVCTHDCHDHYWNGHKIVTLRGHRHGPGCGHHFDDGRWGVSVSLGSGKVRLGAGHVCSHDCHDHYWNGHKIVTLRGHRHGPGCGHHFDNGRWGVSISLGSATVRLGAGHVCTHDCHDHYWNGSRTVRLSSHRHSRGCGHVFKSGHWIAKHKGHSKAKHKHHSYKGKSYNGKPDKGKSHKGKSYSGKSHKGKSKKSKGKDKSKGHRRP